MEVALEIILKAPIFHGDALDVLKLAQLLVVCQKYIAIFVNSGCQLQGVHSFKMRILSPDGGRLFGDFNRDWKDVYMAVVCEFKKHIRFFPVRCPIGEDQIFFAGHGRRDHFFAGVQYVFQNVLHLSAEMDIVIQKINQWRRIKKYFIKPCHSAEAPLHIRRRLR